MLPKIYRLPGKRIPEVLKKGKRYNFPLFNLVVLGLPVSRSGLQDCRFAFVISQKIDKRAVVRNRTKRLLSEAVRLLLSKIKKGNDVIFFAKKPLKKEKLQDVLPMVEKAFKIANCTSLTKDSQANGVEETVFKTQTR